MTRIDIQRRALRWGVLAAGLAVAALSAACDGGGAPAGGPEEGGLAVVGMRTDFGGFNSITNTDLYTGEVINYALFTPLVQYDENLDVRPYLAESWELLGDTAVVFQLRDDISWHDGRPVTAEDVKFTFDMAKEPATASLIGQAFLDQVAAGEVVDSFTIRFDFEEPHAQALEDFWWAPMPKHLLEALSPAELRNADFNRQPVGSGPYQFVEWRANDRLVLERNPDFPEGLGGPPRLARVIFRIIPEPATLLTEVLTGGVDVDIPVTPNQTSEIEGTPDVDLHAYPGRTFYYIGWNTRRQPFRDATVRRAFTLAIDREEIIDALLFGHGVIASGPFPPWSPLSPEVDPLPHAPDRAGDLLEEAGWVDRDGDGVRENAEGRPLAFTLLTSDAPLNRSVTEVVQAQLRQVGVNVEVRVMEFQTMLDRHRGRDFDAVFTSWVLDNFQVASAPQSLFHSQWADVPGSANRSSFADPEADRLIERGGAATNPEQAREVWRSFVEVMQREQPFTFMFWLEELAASRDRVRGVVMDPRGELVSISEWWLAGGRR